MSDLRCLLESKIAEAALTTQYTAADRSVGGAALAYRVTIEKFSVSPPPTGSATIAIYIVPKGGTAGASNLVMPAKSLSSTDRAYTCPELVGQVLEPGDFIATNASVANLVIRMSGSLVQAPT